MLYVHYFFRVLILKNLKSFGQSREIENTQTRIHTSAFQQK